jgi:hypothetical protein
MNASSREKPPNTAHRGRVVRTAFLGIVLTLGFFRFDGASTLPRTAANACRWAAGKHI